MKKINLIEWLSRNSHEKQSPQRFARYAAMLIMLLTFGVGQMWADKDVFFYWTSIPSWYIDIWKVQYWDGSSDQYVSISSTGITDYYKATVGDNATGWRICRTEDNKDRYNDGQWCDISTNGYNFFKVTGTADNQSDANNGNGPYGDKATIIGVVDGGGEIYFDNINTGWEGNIYFIIGRDNNPMGTGNSKWSNVFKMSQVCGTDLWKVSVSDDWKDADYYAVVCTGNGTWENGAWGTSNLTNASGGYTAAYTSAQSLYDSKYYLLTPASGSNGTSFTIAEYASESALKKVFYPRYITVSASLDPSTITPSTNTNVTFSLTTNVPTSESPSFYFQMANWGAANSGAAGVYNMDGDHAMSSTSNPSQTVSNVNLSAGTYKSKVKITWDGATIVESDLLTLTVAYPNRTLAYNDNGKTGGGAAPTGGTYSHNSVQTVAGNTNTMTKDNYTFAGWNTNATISGTAYAASSSITMNQDYTLYAKWTQTITLHANTDHHGTGDNSSATAVWNKASLEGFSATSGASGYTLDGYYTDPTSGSKVLNADGSFADDVSGYTSSGKWSRTGSAPTLYAHWVADTWDLESSSSADLGRFLNTAEDVYQLNINVDNTFASTPVHFILNNNKTTWYYADGNNPTTTDITLAYGTGNQTWQSSERGYYTLKVWKDGSWKYRAYASPQVNYTASPTGGTVTAASNHDGALSAGGYAMYGSDVTFTATPGTGYTFEGWYGASDYSGDRLSTTNPLTVSGVTSATGRYAKFTETMHTITIEGGSSSSTTAGVVTTGTATANAPAEGKKFTGWDLGDGVTLSGGCSETDRTITFTTTKDATVTATYADRAEVKLYFASPGGWSNIYAYAWKESGTANADFPGVEITSNTEVVDCATYYVYQYYTEADGIGNAATGSGTWDNVIFGNGANPGVEYGNENWTKTHTLTISSGHFYRAYEDANSSGRTTGNDWYVKGNFENAGWVNFSYPIELNCATSTGYVDIDMSRSYTHYFQILQASTNKIFRISTADSDAEVSIGTEYTLYEKSSNADKCTNPSTTTYRFTLNVSTPSAPVLTVRPAVDNDYTVTFAVSGHGSISTPGTGSQTIHQYAPTTITAVADPGYRFTGWTVDSDHSSYVTIASSSSATTTVTGVSGAAGATITANFSNEGFIYLDKSAIRSKWPGTPYVYFYTAAYWNNDAGTGSKTSSSDGVPGTCIDGPHAMTQIGSSDIWYYDYSSTPGSSNTKQYVAFTDKDQSSHNWFSSCQAIYRGDFYPNMPMLVIRDYETKKNNNTVAYYQQGYWRKYNDTDPGYVVKIYNGYSNATCTGTYAFSSTEAGSNNCTVDVPLNSGNNYFKVVGCDTTTINSVAYAGTYYRDGSNGTMNTDNCTNWLLTDESGSNTGVQATASGDYTFTLTLGAGQLYISVDFPLAVGDFRLVYNGKMRTSYVAKKNHPSNYIRKLKAPTVASDTTRRDTISFFVDPATGDLAPDIRFQWCSAIDGYDITWRDTLSSAKPSLTGITKAGVYDFIVTQNTTQAGVHTISCELMGAYTGDYYIRTDVASGGWKTYKETEDNKLSYSSYSKAHSGYDYYHCHWTPTSKNVKFTIASDYSECVSDTVENDDFVTSSGTLPYEASVRFMFNDSTNELWRAYLNGSNEGEAEYLKIQALNDSIMDTDGVAFTDSPTNHHDGDTVFVKFEDLGNWVYQYDLKAKQGTHYRLVSDYYFSSTHHLQYFKGTSGAAWNPTTTDQLVGGTGDTPQKLRLVYDYKTNNLTAAWMPDGEQSADLAIYADMMLIRRAQNAATQLTFATGKKLSNVQTMIGAVEFFKDSIVGRVSNFNGDVIGSGGNRANRELMLYISFPFDVAVNDIYGIGQLNKEWYLQYYDGAERASKGFFRGDGTTTFWKYMTLSDTLRANVGYSLLLDNDYFNTDNYGVWKNISDGKSVYLFFPSAKELSGDSIIASATKTIRVPEHKHTSGRTFEVESRTLCHDFTDSDWNMMGVPLFQNQTGLDAYFDATADPSDWPGDGKGYFYEWDSIDNNFEIHTAAGYTFKSMHGYMVQYSGEVSFTGASIQPASSVVARRAQKSRENYTMELQLLKENKRVSRTYIELREEACDTFALDEDVYMVYTSHPADLYTYAGNYDVSANVLSMDNHSIPVGIEVHKAGSYTFSMPSSFNGAALLIDTQTGARTNLALSDYIVTLPKGICDGRFYIEIDLNKMPTAIDGVQGGSLKDGKAHKFIMNDMLYILKDGVIFDARGNRVK